MNRFKQGLIYETDPGFGDRVNITAIVTGLKFVDIMGPSDDLGNYIMIDNDFRYTPRVKADPEEGISLPEASGMRYKIGFNTLDNRRSFNFLDEDKPVLVTLPGEDRSALEEIPAIRRISRKEATDINR